MRSGMAGVLRERVTLNRADPARDALGGTGGGWTEIALVWASAVPEAWGEPYAGGARTARATWRVTMRPCAVAVGDRIGRTTGMLEVRQVRRDPATPDRVVAIAEEVA